MDAMGNELNFADGVHNMLFLVSYLCACDNSRNISKNIMLILKHASPGDCVRFRAQKTYRFRRVFSQMNRFLKEKRNLNDDLRREGYTKIWPNGIIFHQPRFP